MRTMDHLLLGQYLVERCGTAQLSHHRTAFLLGCVEPDYNAFSYLRGMRHFKKFRGHNAENSFPFLSRCWAELGENGVLSPWDFFRLGTLIHYAADAFTAPHNRFWQGSLREHCAYEAALHQRFAAMLAKAQPERLPRREYAALHQAYCAETLGFETDFRYILTVSVSLLEKYLLPAAEAEGVHHENLDHHRLVPAGH